MNRADWWLSDAIVALSSRVAALEQWMKAAEDERIESVKRAEASESWATEVQIERDRLKHLAITARLAIRTLLKETESGHDYSTGPDTKAQIRAREWLIRYRAADSEDT